MNHPTVREIASFLDETLDSGSYTDSAINGLQVESPQTAVSKIGFAVDSGLSVVQRAAAAGCDLLVVHHGIFWGACEPIIGPMARKINLFMTGAISLYASHLPLDGHPELGNAAQLARLLGLTAQSGFFPYRGRTIGISGKLPDPLPIELIADRLATIEGATNRPLVLPFGKKKISSVAIATGSAASALPECAALGIDLLISGEPKQDVYHRAKELECSAIFAGHYATETFGVRALERVLGERFRVETEWISEPTGI